MIYSVCYAPEPKSQERRNKCASSTLLPDTLCRLLFLGTSDFHKIGFPYTLTELWPHQHHLCVYVIYAFVNVCVAALLGACTCGVLRLTLGVFLHHFLLYFLRQDLSLFWSLPFCLDGLASEPLGILVSVTSNSSAGIIGMCCHTGILCVLGIPTQFFYDF